jgi:hypothetical protein
MSSAARHHRRAEVAGTLSRRCRHCGRYSLSNTGGSGHAARIFTPKEQEVVARPLPEPRVPTGDDGYFEALTRLVFQVGFRWELVDSRWAAFQVAFEWFDLATVASFTESDVARLRSDPGIVRNEPKIRATVTNAQVCLTLVERHGSLAAWVAATRDLPLVERLKAVAAPFRGLGPVGAHFFLWTVGEAVPPPLLQDRPPSDPGSEPDGPPVEPGTADQARRSIRERVSSSTTLQP